MKGQRVAWDIVKITAAAAVVLIFGWIVGLGVLLFCGVRAGVALYRTHQALAPELLCPAGHGVSTYGLYECRVCGARTESVAWRCPICQSLAGWIACPTCGLAVRNPLFE